MLLYPLRKLPAGTNQFLGLTPSQHKAFNVAETLTRFIVQCSDLERGFATNKRASRCNDMMRQCIELYREKKQIPDSRPGPPFAGGFLSALSLFILASTKTALPRASFFLFLLIYCMHKVLFLMVMLRGPSFLPHG